MQRHGEGHAEAARRLRELQQLTIAEAVVVAGDPWVLRITAPGGAAVLDSLTVRVDEAGEPDHVLADRVLAAARWLHTSRWGGQVLVDGERIALRRATSPAAARAYLESTFLPAEGADQRCRCSGDGADGPCLQGQPDPEDDEESWCEGRLIHVDRYPAGVLGVTLWLDRYVCDDCEEDREVEVRLPQLPWGEYTADGAITLYDGLRHLQLAGKTFDEDNHAEAY